jgi:hypothetical protein
MVVLTSDEPYNYSYSAPGKPKNANEQAAQSMMQAGVGSLSGNNFDGVASMMSTSPAGNNYYQPNFNVVNSDTTNKFKYKNDNASGMMYSLSDFVNPNTGDAMSMSQSSNAFAPFNSSARFVYPDGSGYEERNGKQYPIQLKGPQTYRINPGNNKGIQTALNNKYEVTPATSYGDYTADDYFLREFGQYMKRFLPGYDQESDEFRQKQFRENQEEENTNPDFIFQEDESGLPLPIMEAGMGDSYQSLQQQMNELDPDSSNYDDMLEMLNNDMEMKYPYIEMAELTDDQMNMMGNSLNTPDFGVSKEDLYNRTKDMEDKGFFGFGAQEPTTREEFEDYYRKLQQGTAGNWVT